ncbi:hypothetical protein MPSEU_001027300 [Mayamaea pseudoterrestris]|nr:hypothetical protein MPSEU_001027300 [Mayamaea pseudoterrestris]
MVSSRFLIAIAASSLRSAHGRGHVRAIQSDFSHLGTDEALHECYQSTDLEPVTSREWRDTSVLPKPFPDSSGNRIDWIRSRSPMQPIAGDDTIIAGVLYTLDATTLKMNIFFAPLYPMESRRAIVYIKADDSVNAIDWVGAVAECTIREHLWYCPIRVAGLDVSHDYSYQVQYYPDPTNHPRSVFLYAGSILKQKTYPRIAAISCFGPDDTKDKVALVQSVLDTKPDLLILQGDQTYLDNIGYGFLELVYTINKLTKDIPTLVQMDDHDYGEPNLWGAANGGQSSGQGFKKPVCLVNALQALFLSHMPDPISLKKTLDNGIDIYYTNYKYGAMDFAVLESRKFKSELVNGSLLGADQETWLRDWCSPVNDQALRVVLTQTPFAALATNASRLYAPYGLGPTFQSKDSNGFPSAGRERFMDIIKGCSPLVLSGDQHLAVAVSYDNYGVSECSSPAAINDIFWRTNFNTSELKRNVSQSDAWGNQYRLLNVWNVNETIYRTFDMPSKTAFASPSDKEARADGFLVVDFDGQSATCGMHSYHREHNLVWSVKVPAYPTGIGS